MSSSITLKLCRFDSGSLVTETKFLRDVDRSYYAISHIWGDALWRNVPGIDHEVLVSEEKARFIIEELPSAVGDKYFWMDVLCIDQADDDARIAVVQHIPSIFRQAAKTIVVKDGKGVRRCCLDAMGDLNNWPDTEAGPRVRLLSHMREFHINGLEEGVLLRLWPWQETVLSDHLQFLSCREPDPGQERRNRLASLKFDPFVSHNSFRAITDGIHAWAHAWSRVFSDTESWIDEDIRFIIALLTNGSITRRSRIHSSLGFFSEGSATGFRDELWSQLNSMRVTSHPRDFILATLPQYGWYAPPTQARSMSFGELFVDCFEQGRRACRGFAPLISSGIIDGGRTDQPVSDEVPTPTCLGDFVKLLRGPVPHSVPYLPRWAVLDCQIIPVKLHDVPPVMEIALYIIRRSMEMAAAVWAMAHRGELHAYGTWPECYEGPNVDVELEVLDLERELQLFRLGTEDARKEAEDLRSRRIRFRHEDRVKQRESLSPHFCSMNAICIINLMWAGNFEQDEGLKPEWEWVRNWLLKQAPNHLYIAHLVQLTAMISCGLGISAFEWVQQHLAPMLVEVNGRLELVLVSRAYLNRDGLREAFCYLQATNDGGREDMVLMGAMQGRQTLTQVGFFGTLGD
ncbi:unnamed protein product [Fusarium equiseti]|uniref:Heterokaryon incompatibility domain-containing protein n=1 Tax=Fusarium equiseti TaxID=61235 RepID=A0A8J2IG47_FUSEQ|nr:unnamed protein product [Fusarium equiseti]